MAGGRVYGSSNMRILLQNRGIPCPAQSLEALLASSSSPTTLHDSRTIVNFEGVRRKTPDFSFYRSFDLEELGEDDLDDGFHHPEKKRRLTADQVQFLEKSFEVENKLEPERKIQLAKDLGLQPRQVAIWFQNRRARWKTKQLEKDFEKLKTCYNSLKADYEVILKEKDKLKEEVLNLTDKLLEEKIREDSETSEHDIQKPHPVMSDDELAEVSNSATKLLHTPLVVCKQEDLSSANSVVFDSDSPHYTDGGHSSLFNPANSSNIFVPDHMDLSPTEEEKENNLSKTLFSLANHFPKTEEDRDYAADPPANSCKYGFPVEDQAFWSWQY